MKRQGAIAWLLSVRRQSLMRWYRTWRTGGRPSGDRQRWTEPGCLVGRWSASRQPRVSVRAHGFRTNLWTLPRGSPHQAVDRAPRPISGPARAAGTASGGRRRDWPSTLGRSCQGENAIHTKAGRATSSLKSSARNRSTPAVSAATLPKEQLEVESKRTGGFHRQARPTPRTASRSKGARRAGQ